VAIDIDRPGRERVDAGRIWFLMAINRNPTFAHNFIALPVKSSDVNKLFPGLTGQALNLNLTNDDFDHVPGLSGRMTRCKAEK